MSPNVLRAIQDSLMTIPCFWAIGPLSSVQEHPAHPTAADDSSGLPLRSRHRHRQRLPVITFTVLTLLLLLTGLVLSASAGGDLLTFVQVWRNGDSVGGIDGLAGARSVTVSPDGKHIYATGSADNAVAVFAQDSSTGRLTFVEVQRDGVGGVDGLARAGSVTVSPDGAYLYVAGTKDRAVAVFSRDATTGALTFVEMQKNGVDGVVGLYLVSDMAISPDGKHLYVADSSSNAISVFSRDSSTGKLTFVEIQQNYVNGVIGLSYVRSLAVSPDGKHIYAAGTNSNAIAVFGRDGSTGKLTFVELQENGVGGVDGLGHPMAVTVSPDSAYLYVAGGRDEDAVVVFSRDMGTGKLAFVEVQKEGVDGVDGLLGARSVTVSPDGKHVYVGGVRESAVAVFSMDADTGKLTFVEVKKNGVDGVDGLGGIWTVTVSPDSAYLYTASDAQSAVSIFNRNTDSGELTFVEVQKNGEKIHGLAGANSPVVSPDGHYLYVAGSLDSALVVFRRDANSGALTFVEFQWDGGPPGVDGLAWANHVAVSPDGKHLYATGYYDNAVAVFGRDGSTGKLTYVEVQKDGAGGVDGLAGANSVAVSPDGAYLYATGGKDDAVAVFSRDVVSGKLTFVEVQKDGVGGVDGLAGANSVAVNPDGEYVYATGFYDSAVAVFARDIGSGKLTFVEVQKDGVDGVDGLNGATSVTISPDGKHLYVAGAGDSGLSSNSKLIYAVAVFSRDASSGKLTFVEVYKDGVDGVDGLDGIRSVAIGLDGKYVYTAGMWDDAVAIFSRNADSGKLTFVEVLQNGIDNIDGLYAVDSVTTSPDGKHIYTASLNDNSLVVFQIKQEPGDVDIVYIPIVSKD